MVSPHERATGRVVRAVNLRMAVGATAREQVRIGIGTREGLRRAHEGGMSRPFVAGLAEERRAQLQERRLHRTVRVVAVGAILRHRLMLPQKRSALLAVAGGARFVGGVLDELHWRRRAVRRMARSACHLALAQRVARELVQVGVLGLMTAPAHLDLRAGLTHRILYRVHRMAAGAGHVVRGMRTRGPIVRGIRLMTGEALRVLFHRRRLRLLAEIDHALERPAAAVGVVAAGSVASLALQPAMAEGTARIVRTAMLRAEDVRDIGLRVTGEARVRSRVAVMQRGGRSRCRRLRRRCGRGS